MRVTKPGNQKFGYEGTWHCDRCDCTWEMDRTDPEPAQSSDQRDGGAYHMPCPTCKQEVYRHIPRSRYLDR